MVVVPGADGEFGALVRHTPMISTLRPGVVRVHEGGKVTQTLFVAGGFVEVTPARCTVLADQALPVEELDRAAAQRRLQDAREDLADATSDEERAAAERQIAVCEEIIRLTGS